MLLCRTDDVEQTRALAAAVASLVGVGDLLVLVGDLGAGKTHFTQGFARACGVTEPVTSPTFTLANRYVGDVVVNHLDALLVVVISTVPMAITTIMLRRLTGVGPMQVQAWTAVVGIPAYFILTVLFESGQIEAIRTATLAPVAGIVYAAVAGSIVGHGGLYFLLKRYPVTWVNPLFLLAPVFAVFFGVTVYGDQPTLQIVVGGFMTITGVAIVAIRSARKGAPVSEKAAP